MPTRAHRFFARNWLPRLWIAAFPALAALLMASALAPAPAQQRRVRAAAAAIKTRQDHRVEFETLRLVHRHHLHHRHHHHLHHQYHPLMVLLTARTLM